MATLYGNENNFRTQKVLAAAKFGGKNLSLSGGSPPADKIPFSATPAYIEGKKALFGSDSCAWEVCGEGLRGQTKEHASEILQWFQVGSSQLLPGVLGWVLPSVSVMPFDKKAVEGSKSEVLRVLGALDKYLLTRTFLVGERLSVADLSLAFDLSPAYAHVMDASLRKNYVNVTRWYNTVMNQEQVIQIAGTPALCQKPAQHDAKKLKEYQALPGGDAPAGEGKKEKKKEKKEEPKKKEKEPEEEMDEAEKALAEEPKKKDPFDQFPKGNFNWDEFKRVYSNEDIESKAIPYFWEHFDPETMSIWYCDYKYPKELTMVFMSCNLIGGMFQRLEKMRKFAFGSVALFGENNDSTISGIWFWRGPELAFTLTPDWGIDYESYNWTKLDHNDPKTKTMVKEYFLWEGKFEHVGKEFNQGKIFK